METGNSREVTTEPSPLLRRTLAAWTMLVVAGGAAKLFALGVSVCRFGRTIGAGDLLCTLGGESLIALALGVPLLLAWLGQRFTRFSILRWFALLPLIGAPIVLLFDALAVFVFWEWGAYLEPSHLDAGRVAGVSADLLEYARDPRLWTALAAFLLALVGAARLSRGAIERHAARAGGLSVMFALGAWPPIADRGRFDPAVPSPLLLLAQRVDERAGGLDETRWPRDEGGEPWARSPSDPIPARWGALAGAARGMDLLFVVLESTRRDRVTLYGCERDTTPNLARLAANALTFDDAWVAQPRSCKTMESLSYGSDPDPRLVSLTWDAGAKVVRDSIWKRFADEGRRLYFGTTFGKETDGFDSFLPRVAGRALERCVGTSDLGKAARPDPRIYDDRALVADWLAWRGATDDRALSMLWFAGSHHPYRAGERPFGEERLLDCYDNTVWCSDRAIGELVAGLEAAGRADSTLLVILGDHGEALREHLDILHGSWFFDHSMRIPCLFWNPRLFPKGPSDARCDIRFSVKDLPATLLWMVGDEKPLGESHVLFGERRDAPLFFSNVYQDFKLGLLEGDRKATFRPERDELTLVDRALDPGEDGNLAASLPPVEVAALKRRMIAWYYAHRADIEVKAPNRRRSHVRPEPLRFTIEPAEPKADAPVKVAIHGGVAGGRVLIVVTALDGLPLFVPVIDDRFDDGGDWSAELPAPAAGARVTLQAFGPERGQPLRKSAAVSLKLP